jgi:hypothetical protein
MKGLLLLILIGLLSVVSRGSLTTKQQPRMLVEYSNVLIERWIQTQQLRDRLYVKTEGETQEEKPEYHREDVPHENKTSPYSESLLPTARRRDRQWKTEHHSSQSRASRSLAYNVRASQFRGGYHLAYTGTQTKRQMYQTSNGSVSHGDCL